MHNSKIIAMIPARLGSQRIPKKNIRIMVDKPLIDYPIDLCLESKLFDEIWINTESELLGNYAKAKGIFFHKRPIELASNTATNREFMYEFLQNHECDYVVMVNPTSPLLRVETVKKFAKHIQNCGKEIIITVVEEKTECFYHNKPVNFNIKEKINSQSIEPVYRGAWALTAWKRDSFLYMQDNGLNPAFEGSIDLFKIPKDESCDLDTEEDWNIAEGMLLARKNQVQPRFMNLE